MKAGLGGFPNLCILSGRNIKEKREKHLSNFDNNNNNNNNSFKTKLHNALQDKIKMVDRQ